MAFVDRVVPYPGRIRLTEVSGQTDVYDMTREEGTAVREGTLLNAANLNTQTQVDATVQSKYAADLTDTTYQNDMSNDLNYLYETLQSIIDTGEPILSASTIILWQGILGIS